MTEKSKSREKRKFHCACAIGDLSAAQPETAASTGEATPDPAADEDVQGVNELGETTA